MADIEFEFYEEEEGGEKIVKEKKTEIMTDEELVEEVADAVLRESEYKQIVVWWNRETLEKPQGWDCTFRTQIIPLSQTCDYEAIKQTPLCLYFEYKDKQYWITQVGKEDKKYRGRIEGVRMMIRGVLAAKEEEMKRGLDDRGKTT